eukprot:1247718-Amphidinium_carterae.1
MVCSSRASPSGTRSLGEGARAPNELPADDVGGTAFTDSRSMSSSRRPPLELARAGGGTSSFEVNSVRDLCLGAARSSRIGRSSRS